MKVVTIVAFTLLVGLPVEAAQRRYQSNSPAVICNNDGHCTTFKAAPGFVARNGTSRRKTLTATAVATTSSTSGDSATITPAIGTKEVVTPAVSATEAATTAPAVSTADSELSLEALQPVHHFDFDVAVLFSDILVVPLVTGTANHRNDRNNYAGYRSRLHGSSGRSVRCISRRHTGPWSIRASETAKRRHHQMRRFGVSNVDASRIVSLSCAILRNPAQRRQGME